MVCNRSPDEFFRLDLAFFIGGNGVREEMVSGGNGEEEMVSGTLFFSITEAVRKWCQRKWCQVPFSFQ